MSNNETVVLSCSGPQELVRTINSFKPILSIEARRRLAKVYTSYRARCGLTGAYERMNGRTVSQILAEYQGDDVKPIASGEIDGVRYDLYEAPPGEAGNEGSAE